MQVTYLTLIYMYGRISGGLPQANATFEQLLRDCHVSPETSHFSAMMSAYARAGDCDSTERLFRVSFVPCDFYVCWQGNFVNTRSL